jgi:hypothetical protein
MTGNQKALNDFQENTTTTMSGFAGQFEALTLAVNSLTMTGVTITQEDVDAVTKTLDHHDELLKQPLQFCTSALGAAHTRMPATQVRHAQAIEHARQIIGNVGEIEGDRLSVAVDTAEASGNAFQCVGNLSLDTFKIVLGS